MRRCVRCGRISRNKLGEYLRPNGSAGYLWWDEANAHYRCEEPGCARKVPLPIPKLYTGPWRLERSEFLGLGAVPLFLDGWVAKRSPNGYLGPAKNAASLVLRLTGMGVDVTFINQQLDRMQEAHEWLEGCWRGRYRCTFTPDQALVAIHAPGALTKAEMISKANDVLVQHYGRKS